MTAFVGDSIMAVHGQGGEQAAWLIAIFVLGFSFLVRFAWEWYARSCERDEQSTRRADFQRDLRETTRLVGAIVYGLVMAVAGGLVALSAAAAVHAWVPIALTFDGHAVAAVALFALGAWAHVLARFFVANYGDSQPQDDAMRKLFGFLGASQSPRDERKEST
ncbi:MAG: hypothetical protein HY275_05755 [Gemmatimonadetes bacterium]|nr:hypothetical protein [Gemmatimonadota bacterium]